MLELQTTSFIKTDGRLRLKNTIGEPGMLLIHAEWCGHCKRFLPIYQQLNQKLNHTRVAFPLFSIEDKSITPELSTSLDFQGYPTLKFVDKHGFLIEEYNGDRDMGSLLNKICEMYHKCVKQ